MGATPIIMHTVSIHISGPRRKPCNAWQKTHTMQSVASTPIRLNTKRTIESYIAKLVDLDNRTARRIEESGIRMFVIYHPALTYFARDYGLHQISIEEGGKEPSPAHLKDLIDVCRAENVGVIFVQPEFDKRNAETIAQQTGTRVVPINPLSYDWEEEMLNVAKALAPQAATK